MEATGAWEGAWEGGRCRCPTGSDRLRRRSRVGEGVPEFESTSGDDVQAAKWFAGGGEEGVGGDDPQRESPDQQILKHVRVAVTGEKPRG